MLARRARRALTWGVVVGGGLAAGLAAGSSLAATPTDEELLFQVGGVVGLAAAVVGFAIPPRKPPKTTRQ